MKVMMNGKMKKLKNSQIVVDLLNQYQDLKMKVKKKRAKKKKNKNQMIKKWKKKKNQK